MKLLFFVFIFFLYFSAYAADTFSYSATAEFRNPNLIDLLEVTTALQSKGYFPIDLSNELKLSALGIDQAFYDPFSSKIVLLKFGLKLSDENLNRRIISLNGDFIYHSEVGNRIPYAVYFIDHSLAEARSVVSGLSDAKTVSIFNYILPNAEASCSSSPLSLLSPLGPLGPLLMSADAPQRLANCGLAAFDGARASVEGMVDGAKKLFTHPSELWQKTKQDFAQLWKFILNIKTEVAKLGSNNLDPETKFEIACAIVGQLVPGILVGSLVGAGVAKALVKLASVIKKVRFFTPIFLAISAERKSNKLVNAAETVKILVNCAI